MGLGTQRLGRLDISEEQVEFMDMAERFCRDTASIAALREMVAAGEGLDVSAADAMSAMGWFGITIPEDYGGVGLTLAEAVPIAEQIGRRLMMVPFIPVTVAAQAILAGGTGAQKNQYLPKIVDEGGAALALSEVNGSFDLADIAATASLGKQGYKLSGTKILVECLDSAEFLVLSALVDGAVRLFVFETSLIPETAMRRETLIDETKRSYTLTLDGIISVSYTHLTLPTKA